MALPSAEKDARKDDDADNGVSMQVFSDGVVFLWRTSTQNHKGELE